MWLKDKFGDLWNSDKRLKIIRTFIFCFVTAMLGAAVILLLIVDSPDRKKRLVFNIFQFVMMLGVMAIPKQLKERWNFDVPIYLESAFLVFAFCGFILGDVFDFYGRFPIWDAILHALSGVLLAYVGLVIIRNFVKSENIMVSLSPVFISVAVVLFSLSIGAVWEIGEYLSDEYLGTNTQQYMKTTDGTLIGEKDVPLQGHAALRDTMEDLMLDLAGASFVVLIEYGNLKRKYILEKKSKV